jgi:hypothetical protein
MNEIDFMQRDVLLILKIGKFAHMKALLEKGEMCFNPVREFCKHDLNSARYDIYEGASSVNQVDWIKIQTDEGLTFEFGKTPHGSTMGKLRHANLLAYEGNPKGCIFSCVGVSRDSLQELKNLDPRFLSFGDTLVAIKRPDLFFERLLSKLDEEKLQYEHGYVSYFSKESANGKLGVFSKPDTLAYQHEVRIWLKTSVDQRIILPIGSLTDIASMFKISQMSRD